MKIKILTDKNVLYKNQIIDLLLLSSKKISFLDFDFKKHEDKILEITIEESKNSAIVLSAEKDKLDLLIKDEDIYKLSKNSEINQDDEDDQYIFKGKKVKYSWGSVTHGCFLRKRKRK